MDIQAEVLREEFCCCGMVSDPHLLSNDGKHVELKVNGNAEDTSDCCPCVLLLKV